MNRAWRPGWLPAWVVAALLMDPTILPAVEIIAHRGASYDAPENTLAAAKLGWEQKADAVEIDIRISADGRLMVIHDPTTNRTTGKRGTIIRLTAEDARMRDAGAWKGKKFAGEKIPFLDEVVRILPKDRRLVIEVKTGVETVPLLAKVLEASERPMKQFVIIAFDGDVAAAAKKRLPACTVLRLASYEPRKVSLETLISISRAAGLDGLNLSRKWPIDPALVRRVKDSGLSLYVWTVDDPNEARRLAEAGVDGITTNRPGWLREQIGVWPQL